MTNDALAQRTVKDCVCAHCWGHLNMIADQETRWKVICPECGEAGVVTKAYAEQRRAESASEAHEVTELMTGLGLLPARQKKSPDQILRELGF
jgi:predicted RNA-binding Zn-ribbon protein involved in translation (DUF1610 family)